MKCFVQTFGCKVNQADSDALAEALLAAGHELVEEPAEAGVIVVNSCTVTHRTDHDVRKAIRRLHRQWPGARIVLTGCYAQRAPAELGPEDGVWAVVGTTLRERIPALVGDLAAATAPMRDDPATAGPLDRVAVAWRGHTRPFVKVQDGCNSRCTYCIVPHVRGGSRSAPPGLVVRRVTELVAAGTREMVLTGIHLGSYGPDLDPPLNLAGLLERILAGTHIERIRLSSIEPLEFDEALLTVIERETRIAPHFHVPLQSGAAGVLRRMHRPYSPEEFAHRIRRLAAARPGAAIGTDVIAGFPGESAMDFAATVALIRSLPLTYLHVFPFSPRTGTPAAEMSDRLSPAEISHRSQVLRRLGDEKRQAFYRSLVGVPLKGLVIGAAGETAARRVLTENYVPVRLDGGAWPVNTALTVIIDPVETRRHCRGHALTGTERVSPEKE